MNTAIYRSLRDLPPLAGITTIADAARIGISVKAGVDRLKRHHWSFRRLHQTFVDRLAAEPIYELKMGFSLHAYYCVEHASSWRRRIAEMREPPLELETVPHAALDAFFDEIVAAPDTASLLVGLYEYALPALYEAVGRHMAETNKLVDHPSFRMCRFAQVELDEMIAYGRQCLGRLLTEEDRTRLAEWVELLARLLRQAGGLDGTAPMEEGPVRRSFSATPHTYQGTPCRDARFHDPYNMGVHAEAFLYDQSLPPGPKTLMMYFKRLREIDVPEVIAGIIVETKRKPWEYYVDMTRQLWDEARHAMMGEVGFVRAGIDWEKWVRVNFTWSLALNTQLTPLERHAVLYYIEQGLMAKTGKRFEWEVAQASGDAFSAMCQDYDWADEVLHARIGRDWYVKEIGDTQQAIAHGDRSWSRVLIDWQSYKNQRVTFHENWWPELYREWCRLHDYPIDSDVLGYGKSYESARTDLASIGAD